MSQPALDGPQSGAVLSLLAVYDLNETSKEGEPMGYVQRNTLNTVLGATDLPRLEGVPVVQCMDSEGKIGKQGCGMWNETLFGHKQATREKYGEIASVRLLTGQTRPTEQIPSSPKNSTLLGIGMQWSSQA